MEDVGNPIFIRLGDRGRTYTGESDQRAAVGTLKNVRISDVVAKVTIEDRAAAARAGYRGGRDSRRPGHGIAACVFLCQCPVCQFSALRHGPGSAFPFPGA